LQLDFGSLSPALQEFCDGLEVYEMRPLPKNIMMSSDEVFFDDIDLNTMGSGDDEVSICGVTVTCSKCTCILLRNYNVVLTLLSNHFIDLRGWNAERMKGVKRRIKCGNKIENAQ